MTQTIIAYIIICAAVGYTIYSIVKKLRNSNGKNSCSDCSCCVKNSACKTKKY
ncbi:MAG: FeoB-associated Cys-rich membrane protein [Bacteroidales bacterium]|nr:FeoB-associated Cys-rich membrane protein [Bacteroidales bacterium]